MVNENEPSLDSKLVHGMQRRMISVVNFFAFLRLNFCFVVAICYLEQAVEAMHGLP